MSRLTFHEVLNRVHQAPGLMLGASDEASLQGTRMARLQAFLIALGLADLAQGEPPYVWFKWWFAASVDWLPNTHNDPFQALAERLPSDKAFDFFFARLHEYQQTRIEERCHSRGPFRRADAEQAPAPREVIAGQFAPSPVYFWATRAHEENKGNASSTCSDFKIELPLHASLRRAIAAARARWRFPTAQSS